MELPKILTASFEESLVLLDDSMIDYMIKKGDPKQLYKRPILSILLVLPVIALLYGMTFLYYHHDPNSPLPIPTINFLPQWLFWVFLSMWILSIAYLRKYSILYLKQVKYHVNSNSFIIWLMIALNLFFLTFFFSSLTILGVIVFFALVTIIGYLVARSKLRALSQQLFQTEQINNKLDDLMDKLIKFLMKYGWVAVILVVLWKFIFPGTAGVRTDFIGFISILAMWFTMDIGIVVAECYLFLPYLLHGYYKYKYPEDYRLWEGKTHIAWYGKKYFDKHIKGTTLEEKGEKQK